MPIVDSRKYDLYLPDEGLGLNVLRGGPPNKRAITVRYGPAEAGRDLAKYFEVPVPLVDMAGGCGVSQAGDGYEGSGGFGVDAHLRTPNMIGPAGARSEVLLDAGIGTLSPITAGGQLGGDLFFVAGRYVLKVAGGDAIGPIMAADRDLGATVLGYGMTEFNGLLYVGTNGKLQSRTAAGVWAASADSNGKWLGKVHWTPGAASGGDTGQAGWRLIFTDTATSMRYVALGADPLVLANASASIPIGGGVSPINSIACARHHAYFCTGIGVADVNQQGYSPILNPEVGLQRDDTLNGEASLFFDGYVYSSHLTGLTRADVASGDVQPEPGFCGFGYGMSNETPVRGRYTSLTLDQGWIVASIFDGTDSWIVYGRDRRYVPDAKVRGPVIWWTEWKLPGERITLLYPAKLNSLVPRLWCASVTPGGAVKLYWYSLFEAENPYQEYINHLNSSGVYVGNHRWATAFEATYTALALGNQSDRKVPIRYDVRLDNATTQSYGRLYAKADAGNYVQQGTGEDPLVQRSPRSELVPEAVVKGHTITLKMNGVGTDILPLFVREVRPKAQVIQELRETRTYLIDLTESATLRSGGRERNTVGAIWRALKALQTREPVPAVDELNEDVRFRVEPGMTREEVEYQRRGATTVERRWVATVEMSLIPSTPEELDLDATGIVDAPTDTSLRWDTGVLFDSGIPWPD